jgi:hypothetical protein
MGDALFSNIATIGIDIVFAAGSGTKTNFKLRGFHMPKIGQLL